METFMNYAAIKKYDIADGPGVRVSLFVSGCRHHCKGCFNAETWDFHYGQPYTGETEDEILKALSFAYIEGFTLLGGEPFEPENQQELVKLLKKIRETFPEKSIWCYTGYSFERIMQRPKLACLLPYIDVLVDGRFVWELRDESLRFRGSSNQRLINVPTSLKLGRVIGWEA